jgi:hypothetical protein
MLTFTRVELENVAHAACSGSSNLTNGKGGGTGKILGAAVRRAHSGVDGDSHRFLLAGVQPRCKVAMVRIRAQQDNASALPVLDVDCAFFLDAAKSLS